MAAEIEIRVNGDVRCVPADLDVARLLAHLGIGTSRVGVERNQELVPRARFADTRVLAGDRFEIVSFVGGG